MKLAEKKLGFGCMRLPLKDKKIDKEAFCTMIDTFIAEGFTYFDTAHGYHDGMSEIAIKECLSERYPREAFTLTNKLTSPYFNSEEDVKTFFNRQLEWCGVDYFDYYLMHAQDAANYPKFKKYKAYETAWQLKQEGKIRHFGISFHDKAEVLEMILKDHPEIEVVQIQMNYVDFDDAAVQAGKCYDICRRYDKSVIVMEPVKGGSLVKLPEKAQAFFDALPGGGSNASYAIRYCAGFDGVEMVLSGMSNLAQVKDNISYMKDFVPLSDEEHKAVSEVCTVFKSLELIPCTACRYCTSTCPRQIDIPNLFSCYNAKKAFNSWNQNYYYEIYTANGGKAGDCIGCGVCEDRCPQHIGIRELLKTVAETFEK